MSRRFKGNISRRVRSSPLLINHLEKALSETSSKRQENKVYGRLNEIASTAKEEEFVDFYAGLMSDSKGLTCEGNKTYRAKEVEGGRNLAEILRSSVVIPQQTHPKYASKYLTARHREFEIVLNFYSERGNNEPQVQDRT